MGKTAKATENTLMHTEIQSNVAVMSVTTYSAVHRMILIVASVQTQIAREKQNNSVSSYCYARKIKVATVYTIATFLATVNNNDTVLYGCIRGALELQPSEENATLMKRVRQIGIYSVKILSVSFMSFSIRGRILSLYFDKSAP